MNQIFVSSVQKELAAERRAVRDFIRKDALFRNYFDVFLFEDLAASDRTPDGLYLEQVSKSAIYLGIFGDDYGSEDAAGVSPTEREFDQATADSIYRLIFVKGSDDSKRNPKMKTLVGKASRQLNRRRFETIEELLHERLYPSLVEYLRWKGILRGTVTEFEPLPDLTEADIQETKLQWFLARAQKARGYRFGPDTPIMDALAHLDLLNESHITHAALLLFGKRPQTPLPSSEVKCLHFHGTEAVKPIPDYQIFKGGVFELVDQAVDYVMAKLARRVGVRDSGPDNDVSYEIPRAAVSEIIVNAIAHRDYQSDASVQIYVFSDRVEVWNPGELPPSLTPAKLKLTHASVPRNKRISDALFLASYIDKAGTGTLDVIAKCREAGLPEPEFLQNGDQFTVRIWRDWITPALMDQLGLNGRQRMAIAFVRQSGKITNTDYQKLAATTRPTAKRDLEELVKSGLFVLMGSGRGAAYRLAEKWLINGSNGSNGSPKPDINPT
ncbi:MAG: ATP-binding protein [Akkermansiaceae bacterium]